MYIGKICWSPNGKRSRNYNLEDMIISDGHHEPIIDMETWDKTQERLVKQKEKYSKYYNS